MSTLKDIQRITLDFSGIMSNQTISVKQGDVKSRFVEITPVLNNQALTLSAEEKVEFRCIKPDKKTVSYSVKYEEGKITVELKEQVLAVSGNATADIVILGVNGEILSSAKFYIYISPAASNGNYLPSEDYYKRQSDMDMNGYAIKNVAEPVENGDVATKKYVDKKSTVTDSEFSVTSENPIQNKVVTEAINGVKEDFNTAFEKILVGGNKNLLNENDPDVVEGKYLISTGGLSSQTNPQNWKTSGYIPVNAGDNIIISMNQIKNVGVTGWRENRTATSRFCAYDNDKNYVANSYAYNTGLTYYTVPEGTSYIRVSYDVSIYTEQMIFVGDTFDRRETYEPYSEGEEKVKLKDDVADIPTKVSELENDAGYLTKENVDDAISVGYKTKPLALPPTLYAFANQPIVTYLRNILPYNKDDVYLYMATTNRGRLYNDRWEYTPTKAETFSARYRIFDHYYNELNDVSFNVVVKDTTTKESLTVLVIGDSTVNAGQETQKMLELATADSYPLTLLGTRGTAGSTNQHEGRGGWTADMYVNNASNTSGSVTNAFYNPAKSTFDFSYYMSQQGYSGVDCVFIQLGINDLFSYKNDSDLQTAIENYLANLETMINSIHSYNADIKIVLNMIIPCADDQSKFTSADGGNYGMVQTVWRCKKNTYEGNIALLNKFSDTKNVYINHYNAALDTVNNMDGGVHPVAVGYQQLGTQMYSFMRAIN